MNHFQLEAKRGPLVETTHRISVAVVDPHGQLLAAAGQPELVTFWRSAAKPFQALPLIQDGVADHFGLTPADLALACASHSSEPFHLEAVDAFMKRVGISEDALACGPHPPLGTEVAQRVIREGITLTPRWSNCSGKHTGLVALAKHHGWPIAGYERAGHPVQERVQREIERWSGATAGELVLAVDGCTTVCFGLSLRAMATAYARFGTSNDPAVERLRSALYQYPHYVAGTGRLCTDLARAWPRAAFAKIGADGIYSAFVVPAGWGIALKVEDGDKRTSEMALLATLNRLFDRFGDPGGGREAIATLSQYGEESIHNTRGGVVGAAGVHGELRFF
jgi:L-asparaginase II